MYWRKTKKTNKQIINWHQNTQASKDSKHVFTGANICFILISFNRNVATFSRRDSPWQQGIVTSNLLHILQRALYTCIWVTHMVLLNHIWDCFQTYIYVLKSAASHILSYMVVWVITAERERLSPLGLPSTHWSYHSNLCLFGLYLPNSLAFFVSKSRGGFCTMGL